MMKSAMIRARISPELKDGAEQVFRRLGVSPSQAISLFYRQVELRQGIPFDVVIPNETTQHTFDLTDAGKDITLCKDAKEMFEKLGI